MFNRHDATHIDNVNKFSHLLLDQYERVTGRELTNTQRNITTSVSLLHDVGNNLKRKGHGELSAALFSKIFRNYSEDDPVIRSILTGIRVHDEPYGTTFKDLRNIEKQFPGIYPEPIWAVTISDKLDIGRHRLSIALENKMPITFDRIVEETPHTLVILYAKSNALTFSPDGKEAFWSIGFSTSIADEENEYIKAILEHFVWKDRDIYVPREWHLKWKEADIPYSTSYLGNMRQLYCNRLAIMFSSIYALFRELEVVRLTVSDDKPYIGSQVISEFRRDNWQDILFMIWKKSNKENYRIGLVKPPPILALGEKHYEERKGYTT
jgi:hypothetical protein